MALEHLECVKKAIIIAATIKMQLVVYNGVYSIQITVYDLYPLYLAVAMATLLSFNRCCHSVLAIMGEEKPELTTPPICRWPIRLYSPMRRCNGTLQWVQLSF